MGALGRWSAPSPSSPAPATPLGIRERETQRGRWAALADGLVADDAIRASRRVRVEEDVPDNAANIVGACVLERAEVVVVGLVGEQLRRGLPALRGRGDGAPPGGAHVLAARAEKGQV